MDKNKGEKVTLWTVMPQKVYENTIEKYGYYICDKRKSEGINSEKYLENKIFEDAYFFMTKYMLKNISEKYIDKLQEKVLLPIWAWYKFNGEYKRPDLRSRDFRNYTKPMVQIEFVKQIDEIVLSDEEYWTIGPLNNTICSNDEDELNWYYDNNISQDKKENKKLETWNRVFDKKILEDSNYIQATFFQLNKSDIKKVYYFNQKK